MPSSFGRGGGTGGEGTRATLRSMADEMIDFTCPRCRLQVTDEFYGPCSSCRTTLRATVGGTARDVERADYEPKMNVTPNAVATKD